MGILDEDVGRVREATDLVALVAEHLALKRVGRRHVGLCPFHQEKTPSFSVNQDLGLYFCFGCQASGDAITFVRELEHLDFVDAVERLAGRAGITLRYDDRATSHDRSRRTLLTDAVGAAIDFYHRRLLDAPDAGPARRYLRGRGFDGEAARRFQLGWAPADWDLLSRELQQRGVARDVVVDAGLAFVNRANKLQDQFRGRLMFPIRDARGEPAGFGGRALGEEGPKYKNSPETAIYQKSRLLYGLDRAKAEIVARGEVVVCEGYTDVMAFDLAGAPHAVATCGTALTDEHVRILKNLARRVVLAYDADAAGQGAAEGWYRFEHEFDIELLVAGLPPGRDPADLWGEDPAGLVEAIAGAKPFLRFRVERLLAASDLTTIEGRARAGERAAAVVAEHPSDLVRDQYAMELSETLHIDGNRLRDAVERARRPRRPSAGGRVAAPPVDSAVSSVDRRELDILRWAIHAPEVVVDWLDATLLVDPIARAALQLLSSSATFHDALRASDGATRQLLERLAVEEPPETDDLELVRTRLMINTVVPAAKRVQAELVRARDVRATEVKHLIDAAENPHNIGDWDAARGAVRELLGWIVPRAPEDMHGVLMGNEPDDNGVPAA